MLVHDLTIVSTLALPFMLSVPAAGDAGAEHAGPLPILIFLHGLDEGPPCEIYAGITAHGPLKPGSSPLATRKFIVAAPQLPARGDLWRFHAQTVCDTVSYLQTAYGGDPSRSYLTGFSFGGNGVFDVALHDASPWAALWAVDPTRVPLSDPGLPVWLSSGAACRFNSSGFIKRLGLRPPEAGNEERVYLDEGLDHVGTATSAYKSDRVYSWLLSRRI